MSQLNTSLTLANMITSCRSDLMDTDPTAYRWTDAILTREIDRANDRYSFIAPNLVVSQIPTIKASRLYQIPAGSWWLERAEYPLSQWPKSFLTFQERISPLIAAPASSSFLGSASAGGSLSGTYKYAVTYVTPGGETTPSSQITVVAGAGSQITLSGIPIGPYGVVARNLYRTTAGGSSLLFLTQLADNTTSVLVDTAADGSLGAAAPTANTTANVPQFELMLSASQLPADASGFIELTCACKHTLDVTGTTIPEKHWDTVAIGAQAFALYAYLTTANDNFDYVDGQFRDRVDDSKAPIAWRQHARGLMDLFESRLAQIKNEEEPAYGVDRPTWGDRSVRWDRL